MDRVRVLFVDDEPNIRLTLPQILAMHGFEVTTAATVSEALKALNESAFEVLLADLNIGQPGDGFTVVSAMRRTHPDAVTIILTGYPAFETALQAIRNQVDDYAVKPADVKQLVRAIHENLERRTPRHHLAMKPLGQVLRENQDRILNEWLVLVKADPELAKASIADEDRMAYIVRMLVELTQYLEVDLVPGKRGEKLAKEFAHQRCRSGYTAPMLLREASLFRRVLQSTTQAHLLALDMSKTLPEMMQVDEYIDNQMQSVLRAFLARQQHIAA